jgi:hypothetical protein
MIGHGVAVRQGRRSTVSQLSYLTRVVVGRASAAPAKTPAPPHHHGLVLTTLAAAAVALATAGLFAWAVKQLLASSLTRAGTGFAAWLADKAAVLRSSGLRRIRRYQRSVAGYAAEHTLGFRTEPISVRDVYVPLHREPISVRDVYVPLRRESAAGAGREDLYELIRRADRALGTA